MTEQPPAGAQPGQQTPWDTGNPYLTQVDTQVTYSVVDTPQGQRLAVTYRTASTTFTAFADKAAAQRWHQLMGQQIDSMSSLQIIPANGLPHGLPRPGG